MKVKDQIHNINLNGSFKTKTGQNIFREHNRITSGVTLPVGAPPLSVKTLPPPPPPKIFCVPKKKKKKKKGRVLFFAPPTAFYAPLEQKKAPKIFFAPTER